MLTTVVDSMPKKRKLTDREQANLSECLREGLCSDRVVVAIWNKASELRPDANAASSSTAQVLQKEDLAAPAACYKELFLFGSKGVNVPFLLASIQALFQWVVQASTEWNKELDRCLAVSSKLTLILYLDELTCGNVLAARKKKITLFYVGVKEMQSALHEENAWLPLAAIAQKEIEKVQGGLSHIMAVVARSVHQDEHLRGFPLATAAGPRWCAIQTASLMVADGDAQRAALAVKGASGLKPCLHCANVISKSCLQNVIPPFCTIAEWDASKFRHFDDRAYFEAVDALGRIATRAEREEREKMLGIRYVANGLLSDATARQHLGPDSMCTDVLHAYFSHGIVNWEIGLMMSKVLSAVGMSLSRLADSAVASPWHSCGQGQEATASSLKRLLNDKMFDEDAYKGGGRETWNLLFLLFYYVSQVLPGRREQELRCFHRLKECANELRQLKYRFLPVTDHSDVQRLAQLQEEHQRLFVECYGADAVRPKHHSRFHLPDAILKMAWLPNCEVHESKHREVKRGLVDRQQGRLNKSLSLQKAILPRLARSTALGATATGLSKWQLAGTEAPAAKALQAKLQDGTLMSAPCMLLGKELHKVEDCEWGAVYRLSGQQRLLKPRLTQPLTLPSWWQFVGPDKNLVVCLH